jgi:hypothetical protein
MSRAGYVTEARLVQLQRQLGKRDRAVVDTLDRVRLATARHIQRLHVGDGTQSANVRRTQALLARLAELRLVLRLDRQVGGVRAGSAGHVYALDVAGQRLASACGPAGGRRLRRPWTPGSAFVAHQLAVTELYVGLREAERSGALELLAFDAEPLCWRAFTGIGGARAMLKPDAFVRVGLGEYEDAYFVEVDRATQSGPAIARKLAVYRRYFATGREQERFRVFPQVLFLVPAEARRGVLAELLGRQTSEVRELAAVALFADAVAVLAGEDA